MQDGVDAAREAAVVAGVPGTMARGAAAYANGNGCGSSTLFPRPKQADVCEGDIAKVHRNCTL